MPPSCLFCQIIAGIIPAQVVYQNDDLIAIRDINPAAPTHVLVLPRQHLASIAEATPADERLLGALLLGAAHIARQEGLTAGYRLVTNIGEYGGQSVAHLHIHLLGGRRLTWPPG